jgi:hypothetical protein
MRATSSCSSSQPHAQIFKRQPAAVSTPVFSYGFLAGIIKPHVRIGASVILPSSLHATSPSRPLYNAQLSPPLQQHISALLFIFKSMQALLAREAAFLRPILPLADAVILPHSLLVFFARFNSQLNDCIFAASRYVKSSRMLIPHIRPFTIQPLAAVFPSPSVVNGRHEVV